MGGECGGGVRDRGSLGLGLGFRVRVRANASWMLETSSAAKRLGTSPVLRMLLMSSTMLSILICVSVKQKTVGCAFSPAPRSSVRRSSRHVLRS